jgi:hypothetical protein
MLEIADLAQSLCMTLDTFSEMHRLSLSYIANSVLTLEAQSAHSASRGGRGGGCMSHHSQIWQIRTMPHPAMKASDLTCALVI